MSEKVFDMKRNAQGVYEAVTGFARPRSNAAAASGPPRRGFLDEALDALGRAAADVARKELKKRGLGGLLNV